MILRLAFASLGGLIGGVLPIAVETAVGFPVSVQFAVSAVSGTMGALAALYAFAVPRRECKITHHNVNNKIQAAALKAERADSAVHALREEFVEFRGEMKATAKLVERIARKVGAEE